ncbi:hypothetical protein CLV86_2275 [Lacinutrix venerupis]|uniref:hypothetical protein n=1 Tax=Lacinutrix venerupis TaxID=1486034 RepID=UPI000F24FE93|nr:hypothetical protein [Lacinutrix venerupis]RLJ61882.1 hypothetical protein CLV86_2275 [Lacinutrix venerupis]
MKNLVLLFLSFYSVMSFGQINNGFIDNSITNFKLNEFTDEIDLYSYYFFIDYLENNQDEFYVFDEKYSGDIKQIITKVYKENEADENFLGSRFEIFNNQNQKKYAKDLDKPDDRENSVKEYFYTYNEANKLKDLKLVLKYDSKNIQELESVYYNFEHYKDSIVISQKEDFYKNVVDDPDFNDDSKGEFEKFQKLYFKDNKLVKNESFSGLSNSNSYITYNNNGYEIKDEGYFSTNNVIMTYNKNKNEVRFSNQESSKKINFVTIYKFDDNNNIISVSEDLYRVKGEYVEKPIHTKKQTIKYKYDEYNNWVYREVKNETKKTIKLFFRTIEYR